ncbi:MAG TPA: hypothetical protein VJP77_02495 [Planctomycetota bacterium]|nr:hypothetical protein [Planctomycetota bacterium]
MNSKERAGRLEELKRSMREQSERRRAEWAAGRVSLGGTGMFAGINDPVLRDSYRDAARDLLDRNRHRLVEFALPIFFLQRHALELALKEAISTVDEHNYLAASRAGCAPRAPWGHDLADLLNELKDALTRANDTLQDLGALPTLVQRLQAQDEAGTWARYRDNNARAELDLEMAQTDLERVFREMFAHDHASDAPFGWITEYAYMIHEFIVREELASGSD